MESIGGDLTDYLFCAVPRLIDASLTLADRLPARFVSSWHVACRRAS